MEYYNNSQECYSNSPGIANCRKLVKRILSQKVFIGEYAARRYVESIREYRDVIIVNEEETDLTRFLTEVSNIVATDYKDKKWIGITKNTETQDQKGYCLWVKLEKLQFGKHWFQVHSVKFKENEIYLQLKYLRPFESNKKKVNVEEFMPIDFREILTFDNLCEASRFSVVLILTIATCIVKGLAFILEFSLKMTHELSILIQSFTPIVIATINTIAKCIGGFYWLLFMLWKGNSISPPKQMPRYDNRFAIMDSSTSSLNNSRNLNSWARERGRRSGRNGNCQQFL